MFKNGVYNLLGSGIRLCLGVALIPIIIQVLGVKQYGLYSLVSAVIAFATLSEWSISMAVTVFLTRSATMSDAPEMSESQIAKSGIIIVIAIASVTSATLCLVLYALPNLFQQLEKAEISIVRNCCFIGILLVWFRLLQQFFVGIEQAKEHYGAMNTINTSHILLNNAGTLLVAVLYHNLVYVFACQLTITLIMVTTHAFYCLRYGLLNADFWRISLSLSYIKNMMNYIVKAWAGSFGSILFSQGKCPLGRNPVGLREKSPRPPCPGDFFCPACPAVAT